MVFRTAPASRLKLKAVDLETIDRLLREYDDSDAMGMDYLSALEDILIPYGDLYHRATPRQQRHFQDYIVGLARAYPRRALLLLSFLFDLTKQPELFRPLTDAVMRQRQLPPHRLYNLVLHLSHLLMANKAAFNSIAYAKARQQILKPLYARIYHKLLAAAPRKITPYRPNPKKILVLTNVINDPRMTGPFWDTLEYAWTLKHRFGMEPVIVNTNIWLQAMGAPIWPLRCYPTYPGRQWGSWPHRGDVLRLFRIWEPWPSPVALDDFITMVEQERPAVAINIGDTNVYTDLLGEAIPAYSMHFTVDFPVTLNARPTWHPGVAEMAPAVCRAAAISTAGLVPLIPSYSLPGRLAAYQRRDFGIDSKAFVYVIVGHRLDSEITRDCLTMLENILAHVPHGFIFFTGLFATYKIHVKNYPTLLARSAFVGNVADMAGFFEICDVYINPDRTGGGSSAVYAMAKGLPVLTLPRGDVAFAAGPAQHCADYTAMVDRAVTLAQNPQVRRAAQKVAANRAAQLCQRDKNMRLILDDAALLRSRGKSSPRSKYPVKKPSSRKPRI